MDLSYRLTPLKEIADIQQIDPDILRAVTTNNVALQTAHETLVIALKAGAKKRRETDDFFVSLQVESDAKAYTDLLDQLALLEQARAQAEEDEIALQQRLAAKKDLQISSLSPELLLSQDQQAMQALLLQFKASYEKALQIVGHLRLIDDRIENLQNYIVGWNQSWHHDTEQLAISAATAATIEMTNVVMHAPAFSAAFAAIHALPADQSAAIHADIKLSIEDYAENLHAGLKHAPTDALLNAIPGLKAQFDTAYQAVASKEKAYDPAAETTALSKVVAPVHALHEELAFMVGAKDLFRSVQAKYKKQLGLEDLRVDALKMARTQIRTPAFQQIMAKYRNGIVAKQAELSHLKADLAAKLEERAVERNALTTAVSQLQQLQSVLRPKPGSRQLSVEEEELLAQLRQGQASPEK